jgi:hypothetical protein
VGKNCRKISRGKPIKFLKSFTKASDLSEAKEDSRNVRKILIFPSILS